MSESNFDSPIDVDMEEKKDQSTLSVFVNQGNVHKGSLKKVKKSQSLLPFIVSQDSTLVNNTTKAKINMERKQKKQVVFNRVTLCEERASVKKRTKSQINIKN